MHTDKVACHLRTLFSNLLALMVKDLAFHRRTVPGTWIIIYLMMLLQVDLVPQGTGQMTSRLLSRVRDKPSGNFAQTARSYDVLRFIRCMEYAFIKGCIGVVLQGKSHIVLNRYFSDAIHIANILSFNLELTII